MKVIEVSITTEFRQWWMVEGISINTWMILTGYNISYRYPGNVTVTFMTVCQESLFEKVTKLIDIGYY
mgnify:CR=1 FL=1